MLAPVRRSAAAGLDRLIAWAAALSGEAAWAWSLGLYGIVALADWATGVGYSLNGLYILPICLAAWALGALRALVIGGLYAATTVTINGFGDGFSINATTVPQPMAAWNLFMRGFWVGVVVLLVAGFRRSYNLQRHRARTDDLTGALTKRAFHSHLGRVLASTGRHRLSLVLVYSDLDGFKAVNDRHGHAAGDAVLVGFAEAAARAMRSRDVLARVGGDEFAMLMAVSSAEDGFAAAQRLHRDVRAALREMDHAVTASMGAVIVEQPADDPAAFLEMADSLMYEVKRSGKDALRIAYVDRPAPAEGWAEAA